MIILVRFFEIRVLKIVHLVFTSRLVDTHTHTHIHFVTIVILYQKRKSKQFNEVVGSFFWRKKFAKCDFLKIALILNRNVIDKTTKTIFESFKPVQKSGINVLIENFPE